MRGAGPRFLTDREKRGLAPTEVKNPLRVYSVRGACPRFSRRLNRDFDDHFDHFSGGWRCPQRQRGGMDVIGIKDHERAHGGFEVFGSGFVENDIFFARVGAFDSGSVCERNMSDSFASACHELHVDVFSMGFPNGLFGEFGFVSIDDADEILAVEFILAIFDKREIGTGKIFDGSQDPVGEMHVFCVIFNVVDDHQSPFRQEWGKMDNENGEGFGTRLAGSGKSV